MPGVCLGQVCLGLVCLSAGWGQQYTIKTIAGNGTAGNAGSGDPAASQLSAPEGVALDSSGNLYIADTGNHCIRKISGGTISTIAGTCGTTSTTGDGAAATSALLHSPTGLAFDSAGTLYIADTGNHVVRKISGSTISKVAGIYNQGGGYGGDGAAATSANLNGPTAVALDSAGNIYIADTGNNLIRKVDAKTQIITSFLGAGATDKRIDHPNGLYFDSAGALYIANSGLQSISKYVAPTLSLFAGNQTAGFAGDGGAASKAQLNKPTSVAGDAAGNIYIADTNNSRIRKVSPDGIITTIAGRGAGPYSGDGGNATDAYLSFPRSIAVASDGTIYIADTGNHAIRQLTPTESTLNITGVGNAASGAAQVSPGALASIYGSGFGTDTFLADDGFKWPTTAKGINVKVDGVAAPIYFTSPGQINFQVPWGASTTGTVTVSVLVNGASSNVVNVPVATASPGLFELGDNRAAVLNTDYTVNSPSNPAPAGSAILAYLTGSGPVSPAVKDGVPASDTVLSNVVANKSATIGGQPATVIFAGLAPGFVGLVQMNIAVPAGLAPGVYPLAITIDGQAANTATIAVK